MVSGKQLRVGVEILRVFQHAEFRVVHAAVEKVADGGGVKVTDNAARIYCSLPCCGAAMLLSAGPAVCAQQMCVMPYVHNTPTDVRRLYSGVNASSRLGGRAL